MKTPILFLLACCIACTSSAQTSVGLRLGLPTAISFKAFVSDRTAFEAFVGSRNYDYYYDDYYYSYYYDYLDYSATIAGAAMQIHEDVDIDGLDLGNLQWYYGFGASVLFFKGRRHSVYFDDVNRQSLALQGYIGLHYQIDEVPINISLDIVPTLAFGGYDRGIGFDYGGLAIRYTFGQ